MIIEKRHRTCLICSSQFKLFVADPFTDYHEHIVKLYLDSQTCTDIRTHFSSPLPPVSFSQLIHTQNQTLIKGSRKWEQRGVGMVAMFDTKSRNVATDVYLVPFYLLNIQFFLCKIRFPFPLVTTKWIGDYFNNMHCAANFYCVNIFAGYKI